MTVPSGPVVTIGGNQTLTVNGTMTLASGDAVYLNNGGTNLIVYGVLNAAGTSFGGPGYNGGYTQIVINAGGRLTASNTNFNLSSLAVNSGAFITLTSSQLAHQFAVNAGATYAVAGNDFSNVATNEVAASSDMAAHIPLGKQLLGLDRPGDDRGLDPQSSRQLGPADGRFLTFPELHGGHPRGQQDGFPPDDVPGRHPHRDRELEVRRRDQRGHGDLHHPERDAGHRLD